MAVELSKLWNQSVVVENRTGAGGAGRNAADGNRVPAVGWDFVRDNYEQLLREPPAVRVQYKNKA